MWTRVGTFRLLNSCFYWLVHGYVVSLFCWLFLAMTFFLLWILTHLLLGVAIDSSDVMDCFYWLVHCRLLLLAVLCLAYGFCLLCWWLLLLAGLLLPIFNYWYWLWLMILRLLFVASTDWSIVFLVMAINCSVLR